MTKVEYLESVLADKREVLEYWERVVRSLERRLAEAREAAAHDREA